MFFSSWDGVIRVVIVGVCAYFSLILLRQVSGKRTLSKMNAFDLVVTVALGSTLATILLSKETPLAEGVTAFALLVMLQYLITWMSVRSMKVQQLVKAEPTLLFFQGKYLDSALVKERVTKEEIRAAMRATGKGSVEEVGAVILETDGTFSVVDRLKPKSASALADLDLPQEYTDEKQSEDNPL